MIENIIFDLYGTLIDIHTREDDPAVWRQLCAYYADRGIACTTDRLRSEYLRLTAEAKKNRRGKGILCPEIQILEVFAALGSKSTASEAAWEFRRASTEYIRLYDGVPELLAALKSAGAHLFVLSNAQRAFTYPELCELGIAERYFNDISISSDFGAMKPDPAFYRQLLERNHLDPARSVMVGNDYTCDILAARRVGLHTCYVRSNLSPQEDEGRKIVADLVTDASDMAGLYESLLQLPTGRRS